MKKHPFILTCGVLCAAALTSFAESGAANRQSNAEVEDIGAVAPAAQGDAKGGDGKTPPPAPVSPFHFGVSTRASYTSNARLSGDHSSSDFIFSPTFEGSYHAGLGRGFAFDAIGRVETGIYAVHDERTFIGYSVTSTLEWRPKPGGPRVFIGFEPYRYDGFDGQGRITEAVGTSGGTDWGYSFNGGNSLAFLGYQYTDYFSDPQRDHRYTNAFTAGYTQVLRPQLTMQIYYQFVHEDYPDDNNRSDNRHVAGLTFTYQVNRNCFATLGGSYVDNNSNEAHASYQSAGVSLGLNFQY